MPIELRKTGISVVGDVPWGTHFCHFFATKQDLLDTLVPYFKAGLESKEFCLWLVSTAELVTVEEAKRALAQAVPDLARHLSDEDIEILNGLDWYLEEHVFNLERVTSAWDAKLKRALALGYAGMRVSGDTFWLQEKDWQAFSAYEQQLNDSITDLPMTVLCTYPLAKSGAAEVLDVVQVHQFATARRHGEWEIIETPELIQATAEIARFNEELERRVIKRTRELVAANETLKREIDERRRVEEELRQSAADLVEAQRVAHIGNWIWDLLTKKVTWSDELHRIFEIEKPDFDGRYESFVSRIHPDDRLQVLRTNAQARFEGSPFAIEYRIITPHRQVKIIREVGYAAQDEAGNVLRLFGTAQDITQRKQAEDELRRQKEILQQIFDHIPVMINFVDADGRIQLVNREWERTLGWSLEEIRQQNLDIFAECYPDPQYRQQVLKFVAEAKGEWTDFTTRVRDGRVMDTTWVRVHLSDGTSIGIGKDITERKQAEEKLKQSESQLAEAQRVAHVGHWERNIDTGEIIWSDETYRIFGLQPQEPIENVQELIHPDDRPVQIEATARTLRGEHSDVEYRVVRPDGEVRLVHSRGEAIRDESGRPHRVFGTLQDVTELKRAEEKLRATSEQLRALSARLRSAREEEGARIAREIHDELGSALTSLRWDLEGSDKLLAESATRSEVPALRKKITAMLALTETTINSVRRIAAELRPSVLDELGVAVAIKWHAQQFQGRTGIVVHCDCPLDDVKLNREQSTAMFRIFQEALTNVLRHAQATRVDVTMVEEAGALMLTIRDNGKGITEDEKSGPLSIGLLGMRERAHLIGGEIDITGVEGEGTAVTVRLPIVRAARTFEGAN